jgi:hypothetical protein
MKPFAIAVNWIGKGLGEGHGATICKALQNCHNESVYTMTIC